jgi:hypothetical protein
LYGLIELGQTDAMFYRSLVKLEVKPKKIG